MRTRILLALATTLLQSGCAANACTRVRDDHRRFLARTATGDAAQLVLSVPATTFNQALSFPLAQRTAVSATSPNLNLPGGLDLDLGKLEFSLRSVSLQPAPAGQLGLRVRVVLGARGQTLAALDITTVIAPQFTPGDGSLRLLLRPQDLQNLKVSLPADQNKLPDVLHDLLPSAAKALIRRDQIVPIANKLLAEIGDRTFPSIQGALLARGGPLVDVEIELPPLPISRVELRSTTTDLELWVHTTLPSPGLTAGPARVTGSDPDQVHVRMTGAVAAGLANQAMTRGQIPARYDQSGTPDPNGEFTAAVDWLAGPAPLRIHAWKEQAVCAHVVFSGTPTLRSGAGELVLDVPDARIDKVTGSVKARAAVWFSGLGRKTFSFTEAFAGATRFNFLGTDYDAAPTAARIVGPDIGVDLRLAAAPSRAPASPRR